MKLDLSKKSLREINKYLQDIDYKNNIRKFTISNPKGLHAICAGLKENITVTLHLNLPTKQVG